LNACFLRKEKPCCCREARGQVVSGFRTHGRRQVCARVCICATPHRCSVAHIPHIVKDLARLVPLKSAAPLPMSHVSKGRHGGPRVPKMLWHVAPDQLRTRGPGPIGGRLPESGDRR
jgi:hypothetical protein